MDFRADLFAAALDNYLAAITPFGFSGAVLVAEKEAILLRRAYGLADREGGLTNTPETVFSLGSVTKQFTAAAIMKLAQMGKLSPADRLSQYIEGVPADKAHITLHQLLNHTAGLINYSGDDYEPAQAEELIETALTSPLEFEPGQDYGYSNAAYSLLAYIVELVANVPYERFLYEQLLRPAGLEYTGYTRPDWRGREIARWYTGATDNGHALEKHYPSWHIMGNGEMLSTLDDMLLWHQALLGDELLHEESKRPMYTPGRDDYGYGWRILETELGKLIEHNGASDLGTSALLRRYVDAGLTIILFCNQSYGDTPLILPLENKIDKLLAGDEIVLPPRCNLSPSDVLTSFEGTYTHGDANRLHAISAQTQLILTAEGQTAINMLLFPDLPLTAHAALNQQTLTAVLEALAGNFEPLGGFLHERERRFERVMNVFTRHLATAEQFFGARQSVELIGTMPSTFFDGALDTLTAVHFERGSAVVVSISKDGLNVGMTVLELAQGVVLPCVPAADDKLIGYHIPLEQTVRLPVKRQEMTVQAIGAFQRLP